MPRFEPCSVSGTFSGRRRYGFGLHSGAIPLPNCAAIGYPAAGRGTPKPPVLLADPVTLMYPLASRVATLTRLLFRVNPFLWGSAGRCRLQVAL